MGQKNLFSLAVITFVSTLTVAQNPDGVADHSSIAKGFDEVLNPDLLAKVTSELLMFADLGDIHNPNTNLKHGKKSTNFVDLGAVPRNYVELAVQEFFDYAFPESFYDENYQIKHYGQREVYTRADIKGAEWWLQKRSGKEGIGFHYDKDEAFASIHMRMKYPIVATITYLTDVGAPTLILNQTSLDGNVEYPPVPHEAVLSYPKKNRHVTFRGDLSHGVASTMSVDSDDDSRLTLLVNWWLDKPMAPNCDYISDKKAKNINFYYPEEVWKMKNDIIVDGKSVSRDAGLDDIAEYSYLDINHEDDRHKHYERHLETLPPADGLHYDMPKIGTMKSGVLYAINWAWNHVFDEVGMLDLWNQNQVNSMFRMEEPKCLVFLEERDLEETGYWLQPLAKRYSGKVKVYTATPKTSKAAWKEFGIRKKDLPVAVMHDTVTDRKQIMKGKFSKGGVEGLWTDFLGGGGGGEL